MTFMLWASFMVVMVPVLTRNWSTPTRPQMLPAGTSSMASTRPPIIRIVLWMDFSYRSSFLPTTKLGPMILAFRPVAILPENTRPKALNLPLSEVGTIFDTYIISGASASQFLIPMQAASSAGPSYRSSALYFWAVTGEGRWITIIWNMASPAGSQFLITAFIKGLPSISFSSFLSTSITILPWAVVSLVNSLAVCSFLKFMIASKTM